MYIGIATALTLSLFFSRFASILGPDGTETIIRYYEKTGYLIFTIMLTAAQFSALFCFKARFLQARVCTLAALLMVGFQIWLGVDFLRFRTEMVFSVTMIFPLACAILDFMAARNAMIDEMTVQAIKSVRKKSR